MKLNTATQALTSTLAKLLALSLFVGIAQADTRPSADRTADRDATQSGKSRHMPRSVGKTSAPIAFVNTSRFKANNGDQLTVELLIRATSDIGRIDVRATTEKGLAFKDVALKDEQVTLFFSELAVGQIVPLRFDVITLAEGVSYVNVLIETNTINGVGMTSYSIPVEVGDLKRAAARLKKTTIVRDQEGKSLHVMPARKFPKDAKD